MKYQLTQLNINLQPVTAVPAKDRGRPPILLDLDEKLTTFLMITALRTKGGVINIHVVHTMTKALIESNPTQSQHLLKFDMPHSWVHSLYKRIGFTVRMKLLYDLQYFVIYMMNAKENIFQNILNILKKTVCST